MNRWNAGEMRSREAEERRHSGSSMIYRYKTPKKAVYC